MPMLPVSPTTTGRAADEASAAVAMNMRTCRDVSRRTGDGERGIPHTGEMGEGIGTHSDGAPGMPAGRAQYGNTEGGQLHRPHWRREEAGEVALERRAMNDTDKQDTAQLQRRTARERDP